MANHTVPHNLTAYQNSRIAQDWFQPTDAFFNHRSSTSSRQSLTLSPQPGASTYETAAHSPSGAHEASAFEAVPTTLTQSSSLVNSSTLSRDQVLNLLDMGTNDAFLILFQNGHLITLVVSGYHAFQCPHCTQPIKTSIPSTVVLGNSGHFNALTSHYRHKPCLTAMSRKEQEAAAAVLEEITSPALSLQSFTPTSFSLSPDSFDSELTSDSQPQLDLAAQHTYSDILLNTFLPCSCFGLPFIWFVPPGTNIQMNIPWARTVLGSADELPFTINVIDGQAFARSPDCTRNLQPNGSCCPSCMGLEVKVRELGKTISLYKTRTRRMLLTIVQLYALVDERNEEVNRWKFKSLNDGRTIGRTLDTLDTHSALVMALSQSDAPWLRHILHTLHKNGASIRTILRRIEDAITNGYKPHSYNQDELDLSLLIYRVGGTNLLSALNQRLCLPSVRTVRHKSSSVKIAPTIGPITSETIAKNIRSVAIEPRLAAGCTTLRGVSLMTDETALEEAATYHPMENGVGGYCWKHAGNIYPFLDTYESAEQLAAKLSLGEVHLGKEMSVVVAHCFGEDATYPILAAPSCKEEDHSDWEKLILKLVDSWFDADAHKTIGPLWSFATDGDATRRKAGHKIFVATQLTPSSPLYGILSNLPGLNLYTGPHEMTLDFDYKHLLKRVCTALRSSRGIMLDNGRLLNSKIFLHYLPWLDDVDEDRANKLLFPDDPQDVPRAVELIRAVIRLAEINTMQPPYTSSGAIPDVDVIVDFEAIKMLSHILHHLLEPFVNPSLSLSEQVSSISTCAHLLFCQYRLNRSEFLPNQLYYDIMTAFKNIIFCIAKQLWLDASSKFSLLDVGTDSIEVLFALIRMCGGHNNAVNYKQGIDRLRSACDISGVYSRNPDLHRGHHRLNMTRSEHVDHINRDMWSGDIVVRNCNLQVAWLDGRAKALSVLASSPLLPEQYDFDTIFSVEGVDMLCVFGGGKYPSINHEDDGEDRSSMVMDKSVTPDSETRPTENAPPGINDIGAEEEPMLSFEDQLENEIENGLADEDSDSAALSSPPLDTSTSDSTEIPDPSLPPPPSGKGVRSLDYLLYKGKWVHKASVCRLLLNQGFTAKSHDRLLRVRGFTPVNKLNKDLQLTSHSSSNSEPSFVVGNPFVTLIRLNDHSTSLALVRSTNISENGVSRNDINVKTLQENGSKIKVSGNVLLLVPSDSPEFASAWVWTGSYLKTASSVPGLDITTQKVIEISTIGSLVTVVNPQVVTASVHLTTENSKEINSQDLTWLLDHEPLEAAVDLLWKRSLEMKIPASSITLVRVNSCEALPYRLKDGTPGLSCEAAMSQLLSTKALAVLCPKCNGLTEDLRSHMGGHILRSIRGVEETLLSPVDHMFPCGFCGRSQLVHPECAIKVKVTSRGVEMLTNCPCKVDIKFAYAEKGSKKRPCRNVPLVCPLCPLPPRSRETDWQDGIWRYNMEQHLNLSHPEYAHPGKLLGSPLPSNVVSAVLVESREEEKFGVPTRSPFTNIRIVEEVNDATSTREKRRPNYTSAYAVGAAPGPKRFRTK